METDPNFNYVADAIERIESSLREPISVQDVCAPVPLSPWQFQRVFRAYVGDSIGNYIRGRRMTLAAAKLRDFNSDERILDIALEFQFGSHEAFTRSLKATFGVTPSEIRSSPLKRSIYTKPKLSRSKLELLGHGIKKDPHYVEMGEKTFIGLARTIESPLGVEADSNGIVAQHWEKFDQRRREIAGRVPGFSYGFAYSENPGMCDESLTYLAAAEVQKVDSIPAGLQFFSLEASRFAAFEVTGCLDCCNVTTDYVYGIWFPQSGLHRGTGPDFELFDHKEYRRGDPTSKSRYFVPIQ